MPEKTKKKYTYGDKPRQRTQRMFELLLDCAFQEMVLETGETCTQISSGDLQYRYKLTKKGLTQIANRKDWKNGKGWEFNDVNDKRWKSEIYPALSHYLGDNFLGILEGGSQQGSSKWSFKIKLWHSEKAENLKIFAEKWEEAKNARSKAAIPQVKKADQSIYWRTACQTQLNEQKKQITSSPLHRKAKDLDSVHVPLGLMERRESERPRFDRAQEISPERGSEAYQQGYTETKRVEHDAFLAEINQRQQGEHVVILGEPGAGKTTLLMKVWEWLLKPEPSGEDIIVAWVPLAAVKNNELEEYLHKSWIKQFCKSGEIDRYWASFESLADAGRVWLLLDGADEMGGEALGKIEVTLREVWARSTRTVITCRLNLWDAGLPSRLQSSQNFQVYRTLDFKYANPAGRDEVKWFIDNWFRSTNEPESGQKLRAALDEAGKERIKNLAQNPLLLTLLCDIWDDKNELPDTQAGLYELFVNYVYDWKAKEFPEAVKLRGEIDRVLGELAKQGINKPSLRFSFTEAELRRWVPVEQLEALKNVGWLNCVNKEARQKVFVFFHPTFQEYFAACSIKDEEWDYFLPNKSDQGEEVPTYRVFEKQWQHVILLWIGRCDLDFEQKEKFIEEMIDFKGLEFYRYRAYHLAAICTGEFKSSKAKDIVDEIVKQAFGNWDENQEWQLPGLIATFAKSTIPFVHRDYAIESLMKLLENRIPSCASEIAQILGKIASGRKDVNERIIAILEKNESEICLLLANLLINIVTKEDLIIIRLVALLKREDLSDYIRAAVARALGRIAMDNEEVIETLSIMSDNYKYSYLYENIIKTLGKAEIWKKDAAAKILAVLEGENLNRDLCISVRYALKNISGNEEWIIDRLIELVSGKESEMPFYLQALETLGSIAVGNQNAINYLIGVLVDKNNITYTVLINYIVLDALEKIAIGSKPAIDCLLELLKSKELNGKPYPRIAKALGVIAAKEQWVVEEIAKLIESKNFGNNNLPCVISVLGVIGVGNQKAIEVLNTLLTTGASEPHLRFIIADSLLKIDSNKKTAIFELENLLRAGVGQDINFRIVLSLLMNNISNQSAIQALHQIIDKMEDPIPLLSIENLLKQSAVNSEEIIEILLYFWGDGGLKFNINGVISGILEKIAIGNEATIEHALGLLANKKFGCSALNVIGRIAVGHKKTIGEVVKILIQNELASESRHLLTETLKMIATRETSELVISQLKKYVTQESSESNYERSYYCLDVLLRYAQILSYQEFHRLWEIENLLSEDELS